MWKKDEIPGQGTGVDTAPHPVVTPSAPRFDASTRQSLGARDRATIGPSISIRGDVTGNEDLVIEGQVEGTVDLKQHSVTIGPEGKVKANIVGRTVIVEGEVEGDLRGDEQVVLRKTSRVHGNIVSPRVGLEEGAVFRGNIDMSPPPPRPEAIKAASNPVATASGKSSAEIRQPAAMTADIKDVLKP